MGLWTRTYKKSVAFYKKAEAKVMKNYFVYLYKDEQKTSSWTILSNELVFCYQNCSDLLWEKLF